MQLPRFRSAYFAFFLYLGSFAPFWTAYLAEALGFAEDVAGQIYGVLITCGLIGGLAVTRLADARRNRQRLQRVMSLAAAAVCALWLGVETELQAYLLAVAHGLVIGSQIPMLDAALVDSLGQRRNRYGYVRLWGTLGFATAVALVTWLRPRDPRWVLVIFSGALLAYHLTTWLLPDSQGPRTGRRPPAQAFRTLLARGPVLALITSTFLHGAAFAAYEAFAVIHYGHLGFSEGQIRAAYLMAMGCEVVFLFAAPRLLESFAPRNLAAFALVATCLRWISMAVLDEPAALIPLQLIHGLSFGLWYAAGLHLLGTLVPSALRTSGQGLFSIAFTSGFGAGGFLAGALRQGFGPEASFLGSAGICLLSLLILLGIRRTSEPAAGDSDHLTSSPANT